MKFDWDEEKNRENIRRHYLSFADAAEIFESPMLVRIDSRENYGETRFVGIGLLRNIVVVLVFTERENDIIRIISLRKALKYEREEFARSIRNKLETPENDL